MTEQHEIYRVSSTDAVGLANELNRIFNFISDRMDKIEGLRDKPAFYESEFQYPGRIVSGFLKGQASVADYESVTFSDLGVASLTIGESYLKITDTNGTVIHQMGD